MPRCVAQLVLASLASLASPDTADKENRNYLGVFTIVKFSNDACQGGTINIDIDNNNPHDPRQRQQQSGPVSGVRQLLHGGRLRGRILRGGAQVDTLIFLFGLLNIFPPKGFGVCCLFFTSSCGDTVTQNISYLQNPGYPSGYSTAASTQCDYNVRKVDRVTHLSSSLQ